MTTFNVTTAGRTLLDNAVQGVSPVLIDSIVLYSGSTAKRTITNFSGSIFNDQSGVGENIKLFFTESSNESYVITAIALKSGTIEVARSVELNRTKYTRAISMTVTCVFEGATKCSLSTYSISVPQATTFREGLVKFYSDESDNKDFTVYPSSTIDSKFEDIGQSLSGDLVPWYKEEPSSGVGTIRVSKIILVDDLESPDYSIPILINNPEEIDIQGYLGGQAVISEPVIVEGSLPSSKKLVAESYIASLYSTVIDSENANKLASVSSIITYVENELLDYSVISKQETITGIKTFSNGLLSSSYSGSGVQSSTSEWNSSTNYSKLPTVEVVNSALSTLEQDLTTEYESADSNLQSQIDAINAGQNLADIVNTKQDLESLDSSLLDVNDKVQILHDKSQSDGTIDESATGIPTVYSLTEGVEPYPDPRDIAAYNKEGFYWHYIGEYGVDSYTKSESDSTFLKKSELVKSISSSSTDSTAPTALAVYKYASNNLIYSVNGPYTQTISSNLIVNNSFEANGLTFSKLLNEYNISDSDFTYCQLLIQYTTDYVRYGARNSSSQFVAYMQCNTNATVPYIDFCVKESSALKLLPILSGSTITGFNVSGNAVANYSTAGLSSVTDGRLTTVDYVNSLIPDTTNLPKLDSDNSFTGNNTFTAIESSSYSGSGVYSTYSTSTWESASSEIPTVSSVKSALSNLKSSIQTEQTTLNSIGSIGLFIYTEAGVEKRYGEEVSGEHLKPVGLSLPLSGQITYKSQNIQLSGTWKLLSLALRRTSTDYCLVMAQKVRD